MPRVSGTYTLPSPPMPLVPGTLAKAEDLNVTLQDIATALTGSLPVDGSVAVAGTLEASAAAITSLDASFLTVNNVENVATIVVSGTAEISALAATSGFITTLTVQDLTVTGTATGPFLAELRDEVRALKERVSDLEAMLVR